MTRVQFYIVNSDDPQDQFEHAIQIALQQLAQGKHLHIHTSSATDTSFLHSRLTKTLSAGDERLSIDHKGEPDDHRDVLLNLSNEVPHFFSSYNQTFEIICSGSNTSEMGRERYRYYQSRGYPLRHSKVQTQLAL